MMSLIILSCLATLIGCALFYLASPNQRWRHRSCARQTSWRLRRIGALALLVGFLLLNKHLQTTAAVFAFVTLSMLLFALMPYLSVLVGVSPQKARHHA